MKRSLLLTLAAAFTACSPDIPQNPGESDSFVVAEFDPAHSIIPLPNDLVFLKPDGTMDGKLHAPVTGGSDAQNEFNRDYLNLLDGFPMESTASVLFDKPIDLSTVHLFPSAGATLAVFDITNNVPVTNATVSVAPAPGGAQTLIITPAGGYWARGGRYGVMVLGGANGIKGAQSGQTVTGSPTWALVTSSTPLVTTPTGEPCPPTATNCIPATSAIPTTQKDPAAQFDEQLRLAKQLEQLRLGYAPAIDQALAQIPGLSRADIALFWTFTITSQAEVTFDPAKLVIPFPNDILNPTGDQVSIPPGTGLPPDLVAGLNTLDGFSTTASIVTENGEGTGPLIQGRVDSTTVGLGTTATINIVQAAAGTGALPTTTDGSIKAHACLNCAGIVITQPDGGPILLPDGGPKPDTLAIVPDVPLTERTRYAAYVTTDLKDTTGKNVIASPAFALVRSSAPLFDGTHSTVSLLTDAQAQQLEPLRSALKPLFDTLAARGLPRTKVGLAWVFTTQSTVTTLSQLHGAPFGSQVPAVPLWVQEIPAPAGAPNPGGVVGHWYIGQILDVFALTGTGGTINPDPNAWTAPKMSFVMSVPAAPAATGSYPVTIFGHGFTRLRTDAFGMSAALASVGNVMVAIDEPWHGDRNTCTGFGALLLAGGAPAPVAQDLYACINPPPPATPTQTCNSAGRCQLADRSSGSLQACTFTAPDADKGCILANQGHCAPDNKCEGTGAGFATSFSGIPIAGWKFINLQNFFATRDNLRQQVISSAQLARVASSTGNGNLGQQAGDIVLDGTKISYAGQSLGGILGTLYSAVAPEVKNSALNVPGGGLLTLILTSPSFVTLKNAFQAGLAAEGVPTNSPLYDTFLGIVQWIIDPGDPLNAGPYLVKDTGLAGPLANGGSSRRGFIQWIAQDQTVPNPTTVDLIQSVVGDPTVTGVLLEPGDPGGVDRFWAKRFDSLANPADNHGFLLNTAGLASQAQGEIAGFVVGAPPF